VSIKINALIHSTELHIVPELPAPVRLKEYGVGIFLAAATRSALKKALKKQYVTVDGVVATTATFVRGGEHIRLTIPAAAPPRKQLVFPLRVLLEDDHLAVIHKPAGILVSGNRWKTIANALVQNLQTSPLPDAAKPQPVHRLDYATTGALLVGKTSSSIRDLNRLFAEKRVEKTYYAATIGAMQEEQGTITADIDGQPSRSEYLVCESVPSKRFGQLNLVRLHPLTGRRHQLRKHLSGIGHPILGDQDYGQEPHILKGKGLYLHAYSLRFPHPYTHEDVMVTDELPRKFGKIFSFGTG
jgi:23S rRNA pseudouridine1911/1915/1917 synthase